MILSGLAAFYLIIRARGSHWIVFICLGLAAGLYVLEGSIVTPSEQIAAGLDELRLGFVKESTADIFRWISEDSPDLRETAAKGLELVSVSRAFQLKNIEVKPAENGNSAWVEFRGNGTLTLRQNNTPYHAITRWKTLWKLQSGQWKLVEVHRLNPVNGDEIGVLAAE
jgi:hypothetical protein